MHYHVIERLSGEESDSRFADGIKATAFVSWRASLMTVDLSADEGEEDADVASWTIRRCTAEH
ncbi:MAG TPA: hypothetical protein VHG90_02110 [Acidimicrobiales bacterium]|nr:hypothetical protein [Acidimicrobiales bacterium]